jgi:hypothetical protein
VSAELRDVLAGGLDGLQEVGALGNRDLLTVYTESDAAHESKCSAAAAEG